MLASVVLRTSHDPEAPCTVTTLARPLDARGAYSVFDASGGPSSWPGRHAVLVSGRQFTALVELVESYRAAPGRRSKTRRGARTGRATDGPRARRRLRGAERDHYRAELDRTLLLLLEAEQELARRQKDVT